MKMKIIVCGKGGCGKSTISTLLARAYAERGKKVLVIDSDESNFGLHRQLGLELPRDFIAWFGGKDEFGNRDNSLPVFDRRWTLADIPAEYLATDGSISLMAIGKIHEAGEGCACSMGTLACCFLENIDLAEDEVIITDTEAGIEHFGRGVDRYADIVLVIMDPSYESLKLGEKIDGMGAQFGRKVFFIINRANAEQQALVEKSIHRPEGIIGRIGTDDQILLDGLKGNPLTTELREITEIVDRLELNA
jgi:CO dehydrogenase maturation factor